MNRRSLLTGLGLTLGGLLPGRAAVASLSYDDPEEEPDSNTRSGKTRRVATNSGGTTAKPRTKPKSSDAELDEAAGSPPADASDREGIPAAFPTESGHVWRDLDITKYTGLPHGDYSPQNAIIDWIFRRTTTGPWHGDKVTVLAATRSRLRVYHNPKIIKQVEDMVDRFTDAHANFLSMRVRFVAAADTRWRYQVYKRLNQIGTGTQGQQIWSLNTEDAAMVLTQMQVWQGFQLIADQRLEVINGQTLNVKTTDQRSYSGSLQRDSSVGMGVQPKTESIEEGVTLKISPLLSYEGTTIDAAVELTANTVRGFHKTKILAPREVGPGEVTIDVPEVSGTRLNVPLKGWPLGKTLLISAGIQPGILLKNKGGLFNMRIPGTVPTSTELLVFIDAEVSEKQGRGDKSKEKDEDAG